MRLLTTLSGLLAPAGYKKKGNYFINDKGEVTKIVHLQKSGFGNSFYVNFGYILKSLPLDGLTMHIYQRVSSPDAGKRQTIEMLLNLESDISDQERADRLNGILGEGLLGALSKINSEDDLRNELLSRPHLNAVPLIVRNYFKLIG